MTLVKLMSKNVKELLDEKVIEFNSRIDSEPPECPIAPASRISKTFDLHDEIIFFSDNSSSILTLDHSVSYKQPIYFGFKYYS